jgi:hypothetical protein
MPRERNGRAGLPSGAGAVQLNPIVYRRVTKLSLLLDIEVDAIVNEALADWITCIAPVRLESKLASNQSSDVLP